MADATATELVTRVLQKLFVLVDGEVPTSGDTALVTAAIVSVNEQLRDMGVCYWSDTAFPQAIKEALAVYVGCHCASDFMGTDAADRYVRANEGMALAKLRELAAVSRGRVDLPPQQAYF